MSTARMKEQKDQTRSFLEQQIQEKMIAEKELKNAEKEYQDAVIARDCRALELQKIEQECRRRLNEATQNFNQALVSNIGGLIVFFGNFPFSVSRKRMSTETARNGRNRGEKR